MGPILDIAGSADPVGSVLEYLNRKDIIEWLQYEFDELLVHGFEPVHHIDLPERKNSELLLAFLERTKAENSRGLQFEIQPVGDPEESSPEKYIQEYDVGIRYEGTELGACALESEGAYISGKWVAESARWPTLLEGLIPLPRVAIEEPQHQGQEVDRVEELATGLSRGDAAAIYGAYDKLKARQGNRVDLHATSLVWHSVSPEDKAGATAVPGREPAITVTIREKLVTAALPAGLDIIKAYDDIVDGAEARKRLEQTNPALVAARDKAITDLRREKVNQELAKKQALQQGRAARR